MKGDVVNLIAVPFLIGSVPFALSVIIGNRFLKSYRESNKFVFWGGITASAFVGWTVSNMIMNRYTLNTSKTSLLPNHLDFEDEVLTMYRYYIEDPYGWELDEPNLSVEEYKQRFIEKGNPTIQKNAESFSAEGILCSGCPEAGRNVVIRKDHTGEDGDLMCPFCHSNKNFKNIPVTTYLLHGGRKEDLMDAESFSAESDNFSWCAYCDDLITDDYYFTDGKKVHVDCNLKDSWEAESFSADAEHFDDVAPLDGPCLHCGNDMFTEAHKSWFCDRESGGCGIVAHFVNPFEAEGDSGEVYALKQALKAYKGTLEDCLDGKYGRDDTESVMDDLEHHHIVRFLDAESFEAEEFDVIAGRGFQIEFSNGYRVSVMFGLGNYGDHHRVRDEIWAEHSNNPPPRWTSRRAELAVFNPDGDFLTYSDGMDQVIGWVSPAFVSEMLGLAAKGDEEGMKELGRNSHLYEAESFSAEWDEDGYAEKQARYLRRLVEDAMRNGCWTNQESMEIVEEASDLGMSIVESDYFRNREAESFSAEGVNYECLQNGKTYSRYRTKEMNTLYGPYPYKACYNCYTLKCTKALNPKMWGKRDKKAESFSAQDWECGSCQSNYLRFYEHFDKEGRKDESLDGFFCGNCELSPCGVYQTDSKPCTCDISEYGKYTFLGRKPHPRYPSQFEEDARIRILGKKSMAESFAADSKRILMPVFKEPYMKGGKLDMKRGNDGKFRRRLVVPLEKNQ